MENAKQVKMRTRNRRLRVDEKHKIEDRVRLSLSQIRAFLFSHLQGSARAMLHMMSDEVKDEEAPLHDCIEC